MKSQRIMAIAGAIVAPAGLFVLYQYPPASAGFYPPCPLNLITGGRIHCPGCGMTRCLHALLHGDILQAFAYNALFMLLLPLAIYYLFRVWYAMLTSRYLPPDNAPRWAIVSLYAIILLFGVLRNLPIEPFKSLAPHQP